MGEPLHILHRDEGAAVVVGRRSGGFTGDLVAEAGFRVLLRVHPGGDHKVEVLAGETGPHRDLNVKLRPIDGGAGRVGVHVAVMGPLDEVLTGGRDDVGGLEHKVRRNVELGQLCHGRGHAVHHHGALPLVHRGGHPGQGAGQ